MLSHYVFSMKRILIAILLGGFTMSSLPSAKSAEAFEVALRNASFEEGMQNGTPSGWNRYAGAGEPQRLSLVTPAFADGRALLLEDGDPNAEIGILQSVSAEGGLAYEASVDVAAAAESPEPVNVYLQMRFLPSNTFVQRDLHTSHREDFETLSLKGVMPEGDSTIRLYLYTHRGPRTTILLDNVRLRGGVEPPPKPVVAPPMKAPVIEQLKDLNLTTTLVREGAPTAAIVVPDSGRYDAQAEAIQQAVREASGASLPVVTDSSIASALPLSRPCIALGNRSTNGFISDLYDAYFTLLDLKYPGVGGQVVRSLHNPDGSGFNVLLVGGSDDPGVGAAARSLIGRIEDEPRGDTLSLGWIMDIALGEGVELPTDIEAFETWDASDGYRSVGYFGWNSLSKRMAMYYMTGDDVHAREFLRLAFPDAQAKEDISRIDGERIENKDDPLAGAYHYNQHMMTLYWDLIEESPVFTEAQRLRITNAIARQLEHDDYAREAIYRLVRPATAVGSRHGQWAAIGLLCLGRYLNTHYPDPVWEHCERAARFAFESLHEHAWVHGESDNLFWYNTGIAPIFSYLCLTGDRVPLENGVVDTLLRGQEILLNGTQGDQQLNSASLGFLHKAAYLTGDGRWIAYRKRTRMDTDIFRLGQSYWPPPDLEPVQPADLCNTWSIHRVPKPMWVRRSSGIPLDQAFQFGSFRTETGPGGDFILLDGFNGASRNPYHTFDILDLRIGGTTLLRGYHNQVLTKADGMVEPTVAMDASLLLSSKLGQTAVARGQVPDAAFCNWQRTLVQRLGRFALVIDDLTFRTDSQNMAVNTVWQTQGGTWLPESHAAVIKGAGKTVVPPGWTWVDAMTAKCRSNPQGGNMIGYLGSIGIVLLRAGEPGATLTVPFTLDRPFKGEVFMDTVRYVDRGVVRVLVNGQEVMPRVSLHANDAVRDRIPLGAMTLAQGDHELTLEVIDRDGGSSKCYAALAGLALKPESLEVAEGDDEMVYRLCTSDPIDVSGRGIISMQWTGPVKQGDHGIFFHLLALGKGSEETSSSQRIAPNAALLRLPEPALAVVGDFEAIQADTAVLSSTHATAVGLTALGLDRVLLSTTQPLDLDWDLETGQLVLETDQEVTVTLPETTADTLTLDGRPLAGQALVLAAGRHTVAGAALSAAARRAVTERLATLEQGARRQWADAAAQRRSAARIRDTKPLTVTPLATLPHAVTDILALPRAGDEPLLAAAANTQIHLLDQHGTEAGTLSTDGAIRVIHWWPEADALLAGCADEKLIAFDRAGNRKWTFTSVMDPAVFRAAKTYWFKTATGHEGIHGIATGPFIDGQSQCIIGSACTAEIVNTDGSLALRLPVFWGPGKLIEIVEAPDGSHDALIARWPNGTDRISVINSEKRNVRHSYYGVPAGHTMVGGWSAQNRVRLLWQDVNADGDPELVSATNGRWNRVTVFGRGGQPLHNAQFGPGQGNSFREYLRDLAIADPDSDGRFTIYTATHDKLVVALDHECAKLWSTRLPSAPRRLLPCGPDKASLLVGCDDGRLYLLDAEGNPVAAGTLEGRPNEFLLLENGTIIAATDRGHVSRIALP